MSAVIHAFPARQAQPDTDELVEDLAHALGDEHRTVGTHEGPRPLVTIRSDAAPTSWQVADDLVVARPRTTPRTWIVALAVAAVAVVTMAVGAVMGNQPATVPTVAEQVVVQPGDTVWDLAAGVTPAGGDVRVVVDEIMQLNELDDALVPVGTVLQVPARDADA